MERIYADTSGGTIKLGRQGENEAREIIFDISRWTSLYGVGVASLVHKRHGDEYPYPCDIERNGDELVWAVKFADVANDGVGECELIYTVDNVVVKSIIWSTFVAKSLTDELEDAPKPEQSWVDRVIAAASNMKDGEDGFSPKVNITPIEEGYRITITDVDNSETFDITNGVNGADGADGADGVSPQCNLTQIDGGYRLSIIDASGVVQSIDIMNGRTGDTGNSGVYLGSGDMPADCNVQIDPDGDVFTLVQETGDSETAVMSQKAVTDFVGEIYGVDKNNLFNSAKFTPDAYYRYGKFLYDSTQYSAFEVEVEKGVTYHFAHQVRFIVVKDGDTVVEELQNARTFTANGTKAFVSVFNAHKTDRWKMCKESLSFSEVSNYGQQGVRGELKDCATSVEHLDNYIIPSFVENENLLFGATYKEGYFNNGAEAVNSYYNLFANIPVKAGVNYIIEPKARFVLNVPSNGASNETLSSGNHTSITPTHDGLLQLSMYASDDIETYAFYAEGAENVFPVTKTKLSDNVLLSNNDLLSGKKWAVFGDSFTHGATSGKIADGKYAGKQKTYPYFIGNRTGMEILNFFAGGRTLACPSDGSFTNSITCPSASCYYQNVPADVDYITFYLGINDSHHENGSSGTDGEDVTGVIPLGSIDDTNTSTYYGAWNVVLPWLMENRPYAHIGIIVSNGCDRAEYRTAQIEIAKKYGIPYIDLNGDERTPVMIRSQNPDIASSVKTIVNKKQAVDYDGTTTGSVNWHPNDETHEYESTFIENFLRSL